MLDVLHYTSSLGATSRERAELTVCGLDPDVPGVLAAYRVGVSDGYRDGHGDAEREMEGER